MADAAFSPPCHAAAALQIGLLVVSMLGLIPLYIWRQSHPHNLVLLGVWTCLFSGACVFVCLIVFWCCACGCAPCCCL